MAIKISTYNPYGVITLKIISLIVLGKAEYFFNINAEFIYLNQEY